MNTLEISKINMGVSQKTILKDVSLSIPLGGAIVGILGPNGAGKSTLFKCITGFDRSYQGSILLDSISLNPLAPSKRTSLGLGYLPQESWLFLDLTVRENLVLFGELQGFQKDFLNESVQKVIDEMKINHVRDSIAKRLSGGEKRRLEFARTLMLQPKVMLLDEPFTGIDPKTVQEITRIINDLKEKGISIFISDHQAETILNLVETAHVIYDGKIIQSGKPEDIRADQKVRDIYLGSDN